MSHKIENMSGKLKDWRRIATRYDRCPELFLSAIALAATVLFWLQVLSLENHRTAGIGLQVHLCAGVETGKTRAMALIYYDFGAASFDEITDLTAKEFLMQDFSQKRVRPALPRDADVLRAQNDVGP